MSPILVVDDDPNVQDSVRGLLEKFGYDVACAEDAESARAVMATFEPDLIILDILLPGTSGKDFCRELRRSRDVPVIFLSGLASEVDRIVGLELGADDYLTKPFHPGELLARVKAVLRRTNGHNGTEATAVSQSNAYEHGAVVLDLDRRDAVVGGDALELTNIEFGILKTLMRRPKKTFTRDELRAAVYGPGHHVADRTINSHIRRIRSKFETYGIDPIATAHGVGYRMSESV